jgi:GNAT superfamily N-acetyltransferase
MTDLVVRAVQPCDLEQWAGLFRAYRDFYEREPDEAVVRRVWSWVTDPTHEEQAMVAELDGRLVGLAHYRRFPRPSSGTYGTYLDDLFTVPAARGRGVASRLISALEGLTRTESRSVLRWQTAEGNTTARKVYDSLAEATTWVTYDLTTRPAHD